MTMGTRAFARTIQTNERTNKTNKQTNTQTRPPKTALTQSSARAVAAWGEASGAGIRVPGFSPTLRLLVGCNVQKDDIMSQDSQHIVLSH
jgi:hypothetical protein